MITRWNYQAPPKRDSSQDDIFYTYKLVKKIKPITTNKDGSVKDYTEEEYWEKEKNSWKEYSDSFSLGSVHEQVLNHLQKGTPLITAHTLPDGDYTQLEKGAKIRKELAEKGLTLDMIMEAFKTASVPEKKDIIEKGGEKDV